MEALLHSYLGFVATSKEIGFTKGKVRNSIVFDPNISITTDHIPTSVYSLIMTESAGYRLIEEFMGVYFPRTAGFFSDKRLIKIFEDKNIPNKDKVKLLIGAFKQYCVLVDMQGFEKVLQRLIVD